MVGFVTNAGWVDGNATDGFRKHLAEEFAKIYVFHLRGNQRTSGELSRQEGGKIFGSGSRAPIAITILVKNANAETKGQIFFCDIGDYLNREQKLATLRHLKGIEGIAREGKWKIITPDDDNDWINQGDKNYGKYISMGDKKDKSSKTIFSNYSNGLKTSRDVWCYNKSAEFLKENISRMLANYNSERARLSGLSGKEAKAKLLYDTKLISWSDGLVSNLSRGKTLNLSDGEITLSTYRPFEKVASILF